MHYPPDRRIFTNSIACATTNTLRYPLRNISPDTILDLQEKYPNASVRIELNGQPAEGGLSEEACWALIDRLDWSKEGNDVAVMEPVVDALAAGPLRHLYDFKDILSRKLYLLDTEDHTRNMGESAYREEADSFSPDGFLFARCGMVANGREVYEQVRIKLWPTVEVGHSCCSLKISVRFFQTQFFDPDIAIEHVVAFGL